MEEKKVVGYRAASLVEDGMVIGLGTGSTFRYALEKLAQRVQDEGLRFLGFLPAKILSEGLELLGFLLPRWMKTLSLISPWTGRMKWTKKKT